MMRGEEGPSVGEIKLAWAYELLSKGFAEIAVKFARTDQNAAWGMLATINGHIARSLREEDAKLVAKGYARGELKEIADRLNETIMAAGRAINLQQELPEAPARANRFSAAGAP